MDYKEKYEMALETIQEILDSGSDSIKMSRLRLRLQSVFPELCELEDEKVRKALVEMVHDTPISECEQIYNVRKEDCLTWLEKQAEIKSDNDDIEAEEKGIREAFNKIEDEKQCKQKPQRMISAEAKEAMYDKPANTVEQKCEESKTKIFDAPTPFEDKLYAFVLACEILVDPSKREFILEHSQEILDAAREQIGKEQSSAWSEEDEKMLQGIWDEILANKHDAKEYEWKTYDKFLDWLKSLKTKVQPKQEWSEKDEEELEIAIDTLKESGRYDSAKWVQSLKRRIGGKL